MVCEKVSEDAKKGLVVTKKKQIHVGWAMMRLNKAGNWVPVRTALTRHKVIWEFGRYGDYAKYRRAGTLKVKKMYVTM